MQVKLFQAEILSPIQQISSQVISDCVNQGLVIFSFFYYFSPYLFHEYNQH
jgi:hypothetical protein